MEEEPKMRIESMKSFLQKHGPWKSGKKNSLLVEHFKNGKNQNELRRSPVSDYRAVNPWIDTNMMSLDNLFTESKLIFKKVDGRPPKTDDFGN